MATSPSHQLGELIGDFFECAIIQYLGPVVSKNGYYLDYRHSRPARGNKREVIGTDHNGNKHKLDMSAVQKVTTPWPKTRILSICNSLTY